MLSTETSFRHRRPTGVSDGVESAHVFLPRDLHDLSAFGPGEDGDAHGVVGVGVAEGCGDFAVRSGPEEGSDLGGDVDGGERGAREGVEEVDAAVVGSAACLDVNTPLTRRGIGGVTSCE